MNLSKFVNKETITKIAFGTGGALAALPIKKFVWTKVPFVKDKESHQDIANIVTGIAIGAFSKNSNIKTAGLGLSLISAFNLAKPLVQGAGLGSISDGKGVFMGNVQDPGGPTPNVMMGAANNFQMSTGDDTSSFQAGEMDY